LKAKAGMVFSNEETETIFFERPPYTVDAPYIDIYIDIKWLFEETVEGKPHLTAYRRDPTVRWGFFDGLFDRPLGEDNKTSIKRGFHRARELPIFR
jgi:hypothetical protein